MLRFKDGIFNIKNPETGEFESVPTVVGNSAYEIAVENGFEGTEEQWASSISSDGEYADKGKLAEKAKAFKVTSEIGNTSTPVYFTEDGLPTPIKYNLGTGCNLPITDDINASEHSLVTSVAVAKAMEKIGDIKIDLYAKTIVPTITADLTYNGNEQAPLLSYDESMIVLDGQFKGTEAGVYTILATPVAPFIWIDGSEGTKELTWEIKKKVLVVPIPSAELTYNGSSQGPTWLNNPTEGVAISGTTSAINSGNYTTTFTIDSNHIWNDGTSDVKDIGWVIKKATIVVPGPNGSLTYTGSNQTQVWSNYDANKMTIGGTTSNTNAGTYKATFTPKDNYMWTDGSTDVKEVSWSIDKVAGSLSLNKTNITFNSSSKSTTVTVTREGDGIITATSSNNAVASVSVSGTTLTITGDGKTAGTATITVKVSAGTNHTAPSNKTITVTSSYYQIVAWASGDESNIAGMLEAHYDGSINIEDYWSVGDTRSITVAPMGNDNYVSETHASQSVELIIIGINHDNLATNNGTRTKAAITVQLKNCLNTAGYMNSSYSGPANALWSTSKRRSWCNDVFKNALPTWLKNLVKPVTKLSNRYCDNRYSGYSSYRTQETITDSIFLLSQLEAFGTDYYNSSTYGTLDPDGTQYEYMKTGANRIKQFNGSNYSYWLRSSFVNSNGNAYFIIVYNDGSYDPDNADTTLGLAPGFCL